MALNIDLTKLKKAAINIGGATYGAVSAAFTRGLLVSDADWSLEHAVEPVAELRGSLRTTRVTKGPITIKPKLTFPLDAGDATSGSVGDFLASVLGTETGAAIGDGTFTHKFTLLESASPTWFNLYTDKDYTPKQVTGFRVGNLKFAMNAKDPIVPVTVEGTAQDESDLAAAQSVVFSGSSLLTPQNIATLNIAGSAADNFDACEINIMRDQEGLQMLGNTRVISGLASGKKFAITFTLSGLLFGNETERAKAKAVTSSAFELKLQDAAGYYLHFYFPEVFYQTFTDPVLSDGELERISIAGIVTGDPANWYVTLKNNYAKRYDTGAAI